MLTHLRSALTLLGAFTLLLGLAYPLAMIGIAQLAFPAQAGGSLLMRDGQVVGSARIGQPFAAAGYLHPRPSAGGYDAANSGGSNLAPSNAALVASVRDRVAALGTQPVPSDAVTASASGLDPDLSLRAALLQVPRIAAARNMTPEAVGAALQRATRGPAFGFVGEPMVNVLQANLALDEAGR